MNKQQAKRQLQFILTMVTLGVGIIHGIVTIFEEIIVIQELFDAIVRYNKSSTNQSKLAQYKYIKISNNILHIISYYLSTFRISSRNE